MRGMDHQQRRPTVLLEIPLALAAVRTSASSSVPYHAMKRAWQLSQWISSVRSRLGGRENGRTFPNLILSV